MVAQVDKLATLGIRLTDLVARQGTLDDKEYASVQAQLDEAAKTQDELVIAAVYPLEKLLPGDEGRVVKLPHPAR